ncbi:hypothetical protein ACJMK2_020000 [Sinanodonta woodiana]|uniref:EGF-like domain-containing protein n=1 Tax=Sinanodonta woodiana TaxID=1069815 RepID=A0ABD3TXR1_SINWO
MEKCLAFVLITGIITSVQGSPFLLFADRKDICLVDAQNAKNNSTVVADKLEDAAAVDFVYSEGLIFWTDVSLEAIKMTQINNTSVTIAIISTGLASPDGLACDWLGKKLYWTDAETNRIEVSNLDGTMRKVLYWQDLDQPRAIALDPFQGMMFWTDWGEVPKIEGAGMDGNLASRSVLVDENIFWPNGLAIDYEDLKIYWADAKLSFIHSCNYDGSNRNVVVDKDLPHPFALTLYQDTIFWTDWQTTSIHSCNKLNGGSRKVVHSNIYSPMDIQVFAAERQKSGPNPCGTNNGGCSHLCLMSPSKPNFSCACPTGVKLQADGKTCAKGAENLLLLARRTDIRRISLDTPDYTAVILPFDDVKHAIAVDYDPVEGYVYWTDDELRNIRRAQLDGSGSEIIVSSEVDHPDGIAVDWIGRNLYWTDTGTDRIEVVRLNGTHRRVLISEGLDEPRAICLDPAAGYIYWTDWGKEPKIERANLDGSDRIALINTSLGWPNGLAIDFQDRKIYWGEAKEDKIEVANLDGTGRRVLVKDSLPHIFGFSLLGDYIYWTDWQGRSIERVNKNTGRNRTTIVDALPDLMGLKAINVNKAEGTNPCADNNFGCSHLCLYRPEPKGPVCACPMGLELLSNGKTCIVPEAFLLFTRQEDIQRMSLETNHRVVQIPLQGVQKANAIDFNIRDNRIFWTDVGLKTISRAFMNGSSMEHIIQYGLVYLEGMAVDWVANNIYWADSGSNRIEVARLDGSARKVLIWKNLTHPRALILDPPNGYIYWTTWSETPKLERASLDGSNREVLLSNLGRVHGLTIDYTEKKLFWSDMDKQIIESSDLEGKNRVHVISRELPNPMAITQYQDFLFWADWKTRTIERANKTSGANRTQIQDNVAEVMDLLVFHQSRQSGWNECGTHNGGCSHLCLANPRKGGNYSYTCACPTHFSLNTDNKTCSAPRSFLLFSQKNVISRLVLEPDENSPDVVLPIPGLRNIKSIDYDPKEGYVYWIGGKNGKPKSIRRAHDNGSESTAVLAGDNIQPYDLAMDPYSRSLFWTCSQLNQIGIIRIKTIMTQPAKSWVIIKGESERPRNIVLNPLKGHLYWTNLMTPPKIERSAFDGTERISLFTLDMGRPGPLAIDPVADKLYWTDLGNNRIECSDLSGGNRRILLDTQIKNPKAITVFGNYLYWIDRDQNVIGRINKETGKNVEFVQGRVFGLSDMHAALYMEPSDLEKHPCAKNNGNCSHICFTDGNVVKCSCPIDLVLKPDYKTCSDPPACSSEEFSCVSGDTRCIPSTWKCDGTPECSDNSDEQNCPKCAHDQWKCEDGTCISEQNVCDGKPDCVDRSDENHCCDKDESRCAQSEHCYKSILRCNGQQDCPDGSDEQSCPKLAPDHTSSQTAQYTVAIVVGIISLVFIFAVVFACRRKAAPPLNYDERDILMMKPLNPQSENQTTPPPTISGRQGSRGGGGGALSIGSGSGAPLYDRNHVTGASSSSSTVTQYPKETLNPPPSPVTDRSVCAGEYFGYSSNSPSTVRSFKQYKPSKPRHIPPPPTTPCSTDVCEDSEPYYRHKYYNNTVLDYDSDPYPPPPTPRSHYFSDEMSCPPSPSTERSFFNPFPPPPSPVGNSDC